MTVSFSRRYFLSTALAGVLVLPAIPSRTRAQDAEPVERGAPPPLTAYGKLPDIEDVALSPDAKRVALVKEKDDERLIFDYNLSSGDVAALAVERSKLRSLMWADNERILITASDFIRSEYIVGRKFEGYRGIIADLKTQRVRLMFDNRGSDNDQMPSVITGDVGRYRFNGKWMVTASQWELFIFDPASWKEKKFDKASDPAAGTIYDPSINIRNWIITPDGKLHARAEYSFEKHVWHLSFFREGKWHRVLSREGKLDQPYLSGLGPDGQSVVVYFSDGPNTERYCLIGPDGTISAPIDPKASISSAIYHPGTQRLAGFSVGSDEVAYHITDPVMKKLPDLIEQALPGYRTTISSFAEDPRQLIVYSEGKDDSGTYSYIDFSTGDFREIGRRYPLIPIEWLAEQRALSYKAADGFEIPAYLTLPPGREENNLPLVVMPHGGPEANDSLGFDWMAQALASRGYAVLQPNYRGSSGYGAQHTSAGYGEFGRKMQTDLSDGVRYLVKQGLVDPKRVAIAGASYGGYAALAGTTLDKGVYNCAVSIAGLSDIPAFIRSLLSRGIDRKSPTIAYWERFMGPENTWDSISPVNMADRVEVPVMLIHGRQDMVVFYDQSERMANALNRAGKRFEMVQLKAEDHWLSREPTRIQTLEAMVGFIEKHNPA